MAAYVLLRPGRLSKMVGIGRAAFEVEYDTHGGGGRDASTSGAPGSLVTGTMLACRPTMRSIIRHNGEPPALPDLRNAGTTLRILVAVNGAAALVALAREPRWEALPAAIAQTVGA